MVLKRGERWASLKDEFEADDERPFVGIRYLANCGVFACIVVLMPVIERVFLWASEVE